MEKKFPAIIKDARLKLKETQREFAKRFGCSHTAVSLWEAGSREAPYDVIYFAIEVNDSYLVCPKCLGKGWIEKERVKTQTKE